MPSSSSTTPRGSGRLAGRAALCGVAASLVKQQGYMLAQIVTEINAPDLAAGDVGVAGVVAEGNDGDAIFGSVHRHAEKMPTTLTIKVGLFSCTCVHVPF